MSEREPTLPTLVLDDNNTPGGAGARGMARSLSVASDLSGMSEYEQADAVMSVSRIVALKRVVCEHNDKVAKLLLTSKETLDKRSYMEAAFRACKEAFMEVSTVLLEMLQDGSGSAARNLDCIKKAVHDALQEQSAGVSVSTLSSVKKTYSSAVSSSLPKVRVSGGPVVEVPTSTSFYIIPSDKHAHKFTSSQATKSALNKAFKPSECGLKVNRITYARNNGVRIDATAPDILKLKAHPDIIKAGLDVVESIKQNPRLIVHGVPAEMSTSDIRNELIAQNLNNDKNADVKVIYVFPIKANRKYTSCILEVSPDIRDRLFKGQRIYLRFSACRFGDHVRVLQCYRCSNFGHLARDCKLPSACGHCAEIHELKDCLKKELPPICANCSRFQGNSSHKIDHSAFDAKKCPILAKRIKDKISLINYG